MRIKAVLASVCLCLAAGQGLADEPPAALVMSLSGSTTPPMSEMSEIPSGARVQLGSGTELTLLDYARCKMVTVNGGSLTVTRFDFLADGKIVSETTAPCPHVQQLGAAATGAVAGGLVVRGMASTPRWPLDREMVFAGDGSDKLKSAAIFAEGKLDTPLVQLEVSGHKARLPMNAATLPPNQRYVLRLVRTDRPAPVDITFIGAPPTASALIVVLRGQ